MPVASELLIVMRLGPRTMVRNGVLIGLAGGIVAADHPGVIGVGHASRANALTARRGWLGAAGGAGLAGAVGSWFGLLDLSTADAVATRSTFNDAITCPNGCFCCRLTFGPKEANLPDLLLQRLHRIQRRRGHPDAHRHRTGELLGNKVKLKGRKVFVSTGALRG